MKKLFRSRRLRLDRLAGEAADSRRATCGKKIGVAGEIVDASFRDPGVCELQATSILKSS